MIVLETGKKAKVIPKRGHITKHTQVLCKILMTSWFDIKAVMEEITNATMDGVKEKVRYFLKKLELKIPQFISF